MVVLISGGGSNLEALLQATEADDLPVQVVAVGADRPGERTRARPLARHPGLRLRARRLPGPRRLGDALLTQVQRFGADLVVLSGFMRLLPPASSPRCPRA